MLTRPSTQMMKKRKMNLQIKFLFVSILVLPTFGCQANQSILNSGKSNNPANTTNSAERPKDTFESALGGVRRSGFSYIFVIRRPDGGQFTKEDKTYIRANSPAETNQFVLTDEERVIIAGSNYPFPPESLELLRKIFTVEDLSPPKEPNVNGVTDANSNSATNDNSNSKANVVGNNSNSKANVIGNN
jgi:hypothetical protein